MKNEFKYREHYSGYGLNTAGIAKLNKILAEKAYTTVREEYRKIILLKQDLDTIQTCLQASEANYDFAYSPIWSFLEDNCEQKGYALYHFNDEEILSICDAIEEYGESKLDFEVLHELCRWYGVERESTVILKDFVEPDGRDCRNNEYDGPEEIFSFQHWEE